MNGDAIRIKENLGREPVKTLMEFFDVYNKQTKLENIYIGEIVDNDDPERLGRCRIRVFSIFGDDVPDNKLPWALPEFNFIGSNVGSFVVPTIGTLVNVYFDRGEIYLPRYTTKVLNTNQLPTNKDTDYPDNMIFFETENGDSFELNRRQNTATYTHSSGSTISISADGSITIESVTNIKTSHGLILEDDGSVVVPSGQGPYCAIPTCPIAGIPHTGTQCAPGGA